MSYSEKNIRKAILSVMSKEPDSNKRTECNHIWIMKEDKKSLYCYDCKLEKVIQEGTKLE
jgi:hypothetical protein